MTRILLIQALADQHIYSAFTRSLREELVRQGCEAAILDLSALAGLEAAACLLERLTAEPPDAVLSFSSFYASLSLPGDETATVYDALGVKFVGWQLDHPVYARQSLDPKLQNRYAVYANPSHRQYAEAVGLPGRHLVMLPGGDPPLAEPKAFAARELHVLVAATRKDEPRAFWEDYEDGAARRLLQDMAGQLMAAREPSVLAAFTDTVAKLRLGLALGRDPAFDEVLRRFFCDALTYVRHNDRLEAVRALAQSGARLTLCGDGWQEMLGRFPNVNFLGSTSFAELKELYGNARVVLNLNGANGGCERAIDAALAGAAVVSDNSCRLEQLLGVGEGLAVYNRAKPSTLPSVVARLLERDAGARVAARGRERVLRSGLWSHRVQQLLAFLEERPAVS